MTRKGSADWTPWGRTLPRKRRKTAHSPKVLRAKVDLRRQVLEAVGAERAAVFDAFAGDGTLYRHVWAQAAVYGGCDLDFYRDERTAFVADNQRVMRAIDLSAFNVFDFDAYGSPWEQCVILAARRSMRAGERVGLVLTDGSGFKLKFSTGGDKRSIPKGIRELAGIGAGAVGAYHFAEDLSKRCLHETARRMGGRVERMMKVDAAVRGSATRYVAAVFQA